jgi:hypothetical protein
MSTIAPPTKPLNPALVDSEHYIDAQIKRTRRALKLVDLAAGVITLAIGLLGFVLLAAVLDHWVVPGGLSELGRMAVFGLMLVALALYGWRQFIPLLRPINPVYAAQTIERHAPSLKNSLLNLLWFRTHRQPMSARVYHALEQQAAQRLSSAPIDTSIDRGALLRLGYALLAIVAVCAIYAVLSPKNMAVSAARVLAPWSDLAAPSRVQIVDIKPGETSVARGEQLEISAEIHGLRDDERVRIRYSTLDEQTVDQSAPMKLPEANARRFQGELPRDNGDDNGEDSGVQQDLVYWIEAGDARSRKYKVSVFTRPTIIVQKVRYDYPAYTGFPSNETESTGDIRGIEGTSVTISALANKPIKSAYIDFDADGRNDLKMNADGTRATATFKLALREDRRTPQHVSYLLRFTSSEGRANIDPPKYRIDVTPDYAPEIRVTAPEEPELTVRVDETIPIGVEARDPDFALAGVRLVGKVKDSEATLAELLTKRHEGRYGATKLFTPGAAKLKAGDVLEYWAEARDNRRPDANIALSEHRRLRIAGPADQPPRNGQQQQQPGGQQQQDGQQQDGGNAQNGEQGQAGEQGQNGQGQEGDQQNGQNDGGQNQGQQGAGGQGQQNDQAQGQQGAGGRGQNGQAQPNDAQQQNQQGGAGGGDSQQPDQQNPQQQPQNGSNGGANAGQADGNQQQQQNQQPQPDNQGGAQSNDAGEQQGQPQDAAGDSPSAGGEAQNGAQQPQQKVSSQGDDDSTAMQRMMEHLNKQYDQQQPNSTDQQQQAQPNEAGQQADGQNAAQQNPQQGGQADANQGNQPQGQQPNAAQQNEGQSASRTQGQPGAADQAQQQGQRNQQEGAEGEPASAGGQEQNAANQSGRQNQSASPPDKSTGPAGASQTSPQQKAAAEGAQSNEPRQPAGDAEQQAQGQRDGERQGSDTPRESKPGDGNPNQQQGAQDPSAESNVNNNQSDAGAGHNSEEQEGTASTFDKRAADKQDGDRNQKLMNDEEAPSGSDSKRESDSEGGQSGDQAGGGQEGAGQHADAPGKGSPGQNEAADTGGGRADEQGEGETGSQAGDQQLADGQTGQSSGDQKGQGSQQGEAGEQQDGQSAQAKPQAKPGQPGEGASAGGQAGDQQQQQQADAQQGEQNQQPQNNQSGQQPPSNNPAGGQAGSAQPQGGGQGSAALSSQPPLTDEQKADEANLTFAQQQTNLVLESLDQQLAKKQVDQNLLKNLGWTEQELQQFVNRWKDLKARAASEGDKGEAKAELDDALRSLGLRRLEPTRANVQSEADKLRVNDSYRSRPPLEYADRVRAYSKNVASESK